MGSAVNMIDTITNLFSLQLERFMERAGVIPY